MLQSGATLWQSGTGITKWGNYYKVGHCSSPQHCALADIEKWKQSVNNKKVFDAITISHFKGFRLCFLQTFNC